MSNDVLITPGSRKVEFKDSSANVDAKIETDASGNLIITNTGGDISIGDTTSDIFVGDGTNNIDIVFEQDGEIRGTSGVTVTLGASGSNVRMATDLNLNSNDITNVGDLTATNLTLSSLSAQNSEATAVMINGSGIIGTRELGSNAFNSTSYLTGNQTITLSGDVSGSGTTSINVTVADNSHAHDTWNLNAAASNQNIDTAYANKFWSQDRAQQTTLGTYPTQYSFVANLGGYKSQGIQLASQYGTSKDLWFRTGTDNGSSENGANVWKNWRKLFHDDYHPNADTWTTARTITLGGDLTGNVSINGSANVTLTAAVVDDSHNHIISNIDNLQSTLDAKAPTSTTVTTNTTQTISGTKTITTTLKMSSGQKITLKDDNHFVQYLSTGFSGSTIDGPVVVGHQGGELGTNLSSNNYSLRWDSAGNIIVRNDGFFNGTKLEGDGKEMIRYSDSWLRLNPANEFTSGIYCGSGILRTDGEFQVGGSGGYFKVTSTGTVTLAGTLDGRDIATDGSKLDGIASGADVTPSWVPSSNPNYAYYDHFRSLGTQAFTAGGGSNSTMTTAQYISEMEGDGAFDSYTSAFKTSWSYASNDNLSDAGTFGPTETAGMSHLTWTDNSNDSTRGNITVLAIAPNTGGSAGGVYVYNDQGSSYSPGWREIWTSSTDGAGSGLDADYLDGQHGSYYLNYNNFTNTPTIPSLSGYATESYVGTQISNLVDSAPGTLNTLNELAAALGDDANFSTTVTNSIATKLPLAGGTMTGNLTVPQVITTNNGNGTNIRIGDDAWFGDTNVANTIQVTGVQDGTKGYIVFGSSDNTALGRSGTGNLTYGSNNVFHDGYHPNADTWTTARTITLGGDLTGNVSINGSANVTLTAAVADDSHNHVISNVDGLQTALDAKLPLTGGTITGGLTISGSVDSGGTDYGFYQSAGTNLILKGDASGRSGIFFESEKNGTNINDPSDYGFIQFHSYGYGGSSGESIDMVIGTANDSTDHVIIQSPYNGGVKVGYKDATSGTGLTLQTVFHDAYHPNADKWTTSRTLTLSGDVSGSVSFDGSGAINMTNTAVANNSHQHSQLYENGTIDFGASYVQWTDQNGTGGTGLDGAAPRNPANGWYHNLIFNHANGSGYYSQIATGLNSSDIYFTRVQGGTAQAWQRIFADDYHPNADKWTTAKTITLGGDLTGNVSIDGSANVTLTAAVVDDSHNHDASNINSGRFSDSRMPTTIGGSASTTFIGTFSGNASTASNVPVYTAGLNSTHYVTFASTNGGGQSDGTNAQARFTDGGLTYNPSTNALGVGGALSVGSVDCSGDIVADGDFYGRAVNAAYSSIYRIGGVYFTWDSDTYGTNIHHSIRSTYGDTYGDDITLNSYDKVRINIDTNNNNSTTDERFEIGHNTTGTANTLFQINGDALMTLGYDGKTPLYRMIYDDNHANGNRWDTQIEIGRSNEFLVQDGSYPLYEPANAGHYGMKFQGNSDAVFYGAEQYTSGNYRPVIAWGDDSSDSPFFLRYNWGTKFAFTYNGIFHADNDIIAFSTTTSDAKYKDNVSTIENALDKVQKLRGVEFDWNATSRKGEHDIGFIAQEIEEVIPEVVTEQEMLVGDFEDSGEKAKTVAYGQVTALLVEAIKEQQETINKLIDRIDSLEKGE